MTLMIVLCLISIYLMIKVPSLVLCLSISVTSLIIMKFTHLILQKNEERRTGISDNSFLKKKDCYPSH